MDSKNISFGADGYNWLIKFDVFFPFYVLVDYLGILSFSKFGANNFSFTSYFLSLDDSKSLVVSSSFNVVPPGIHEDVVAR